MSSAVNTNTNLTTAATAADSSGATGSDGSSASLSIDNTVVIESVTGTVMASSSFPSPARARQSRVIKRNAGPSVTAQPTSDFTSVPLPNEQVPSTRPSRKRVKYSPPGVPTTPRQARCDSSRAAMGASISLVDK